MGRQIEEVRAIGLDYGSKTVGVAVTDGIGLTAVSLEIIRREKENHLRKTCARIEEIIRERRINTIVVGLPLNMNGKEGERAGKAREFAAMLERRTGIEPVMVDERLTTVEADEIIRLTGNHKKDRKEHIDSMAAAIILEDFLNMHRDQNGKDQI